MQGCETARNGDGDGQMKISSEWNQTGLVTFFLPTVFRELRVRSGA